MTVNVDPFAIFTVPNARLFVLVRLSLRLLVHELSETYVSDAGGVVAHQVNCRMQYCGINVTPWWRFCNKIIEIKLVEVHALNEIAQGLGLKAGDLLVA